MTEAIWVALIGASAVLVPALSAGIYRLLRDRNTAREAEMQAAKDEAAAQARLQARTEAAEQTVAQLKAEIAGKDAALAECTTARSELRHLLRSCREDS